jgi:hypothetical protein
MKMISNGKTLNYKIVDLVESYNFHIKFTSIRVHAKNLQLRGNVKKFKSPRAGGGAPAWPGVDPRATAPPTPQRQALAHGGVRQCMRLPKDDNIYSSCSTPFDSAPSTSVVCPVISAASSRRRCLLLQCIGQPHPPCPLLHVILGLHCL